MKTNIVSIPVRAGNISHLNDPQGRGHNAFHAYVKVSDLPLNLPMGVNPRSQNLQSRVARQIQNGLVENEEVFHLLNRGLTITALNAKYNEKQEQLLLEMAGNLYGVLDGGHSYAVIRKNIEPYLVNKEDATEIPEYMDAFVKIEVLEGIKSDLVTDLAQARNTSAQVRDESLANLEGSFDWLKDALAGSRFANEIAYKENEDDDVCPIDVREIIALMTLFHPRFEGTDNPPILGYSSKGRSLQLFRSEPDGYMKLKPILVDILELYDYIHLRFADIYAKVGGLMGGTGETDKRKSKSVKLAKVIGVKKIEGGFPLFYTGKTAEFRFPDGWLYPLVSAMRGIVSYKGNAKWKAKPQAFFDKVGNALVKATLEVSRDLGRNPNAVGKSRPHWMQLHEKVINKYLGLLNSDTDKEVLV